MDAEFEDDRCKVTDHLHLSSVIIFGGCRLGCPSVFRLITSAQPYKYPLLHILVQLLDSLIF